MFDLGFWELALVALVALVVIGPERMPHMIRTTGIWLGRLRGMTLTVREELEKELYQMDSGGQNKKSFDDMQQMISEASSEFSSIEQELKNTGSQLIEHQTKRQSKSSHGE
jgi:sec-independent protein translocase protein TatB